MPPSQQPLPAYQSGTYSSAAASPPPGAGGHGGNFLFTARPLGAEPPNPARVAPLQHPPMQQSMPAVPMQGNTAQYSSKEHHARRTYSPPLPYGAAYSGAEGDLPASMLKAKRKRASWQQVQILNAVSEKTLFPSTDLRIALGRELRMAPRTVQIWFQNRRQLLKSQAKASGRLRDSSGGYSPDQHPHLLQSNSGKSLRGARRGASTNHSGEFSGPSVSPSDPAHTQNVATARLAAGDLYQQTNASLLEEDDRAAWEVFRLAVEEHGRSLHQPS